MFPSPYIHKKMFYFQSIRLIFFSCLENYIEWTKKVYERPKINQLHWAVWFNAFTARPRVLSPRGTVYPERLPDLCLYFRRFREVLHRESKQIWWKKMFLKKSYNVCADPKPMYHMTHVQLTRQDGGLSAMFISLAIELFDLSRESKQIGWKAELKKKF